MRWADLVLAYVRVLIWPVVIIVLLFFNRQVRAILSHLTDRIKDLRSVRGFGAELAFDPDQKMVEARKEVGKASESAPPAEPAPESDPEIDQQTPRRTREATQFWAGRILDTLADSVQDSPQTTIVAAWQQLDAVVATLYRQLNLERLPPGAGTVTQTAAICSILAEAHVLDNDRAGSVLSAATQLAQLRRSVETRVVTKLEAYDFADSVRQISKILIDAYMRLPETPAHS
jgi:hypothetical protein